MDRRSFGNSVWGVAAASAGLTLSQPANAQVIFDPAMYGDQELRVSAVDSVKERVRRAILQNPKLAPAFFEISLLDALSYDAKTNQYGPDGTILTMLLSTKTSDPHVQELQQAAVELAEAEAFLRKKNAVSIADAVAIAGSEAIESIGGPSLTVQLGRGDTAKNTPINTALPLNLFSGQLSNEQVLNVFLRAGLTEREMTALLTALLTLQTVEKTRSADDWKQSAKPKFREAGKMGRMSEFRKLSEEDIAEAEAQAELEADPEYEDPDDGWYIAESFGSKETRFGERIGKDEIDEKTFNKYVKELDTAIRKKDKNALEKFGWIASLLSDPLVPTAQTWVSKYAASNLNYKKDLGLSYGSITQLGAVYTGGKYENLLKGKPRKSLNDDDLKLF